MSDAGRACPHAHVELLSPEEPRFGVLRPFRQPWELRSIRGPNRTITRQRSSRRPLADELRQGGPTYGSGPGSSRPESAISCARRAVARGGLTHGALPHLRSQNWTICARRGGTSPTTSRSRSYRLAIESPLGRSRRTRRTRGSGASTPPPPHRSSCPPIILILPDLASRSRIANAPATGVVTMVEARCVLP